MRKNLSAIVLFLFSAIISVGQTGSIVFTNRQYATQLRLRQLQTETGVAEAMAATERFTADFRQTGYFDSVTVALVFHFMPLPSGVAAISPADVQAQLDRLNVDFFAPEHPYLAESYQHPALRFDAQGQVTGNQADAQVYLHEADRAAGFAERAEQPLIRFCLAVTDPNGQPTGGLVYPNVPAREWGIGDALCRSESGGSDPWPIQRYCNVWVARLADNYAGYAQMPGGPAATDGIVIDDRFFARAHADPLNPFCLGRTLSHLLGSYLNLYELWNEFYPCTDDYVDDTPIHSGPNDGLALYKHVSLCSDDYPVEMTSNLMDNTDDAGQYLFTHGQVLRMQATLAEGGPRGSLRFMSTACSDGYAGDQTDQRDSQPAYKVSENLKLLVFPNPASSQFTLEIRLEPEGIANWSVLNALGQVVYRQSENTFSGVMHRVVDVAAWPPGLYTIQVASGELRASQKIVLER